MDIPQKFKIAADFISLNDTVADIGSDHGIFPIYLAKLGYTNLYACDNKKGPYQKLVDNIKENLCENSINCKLSDGLDDLPEDIDTVVIMGMGGLTIKTILSKNMEKLNHVNKLILSPQSEMFELRKFMQENNFTITEEVVFEETKKFYPIIVYSHTETPTDFNDFELEFGPVALQKKDPTLLKLLTKKYEYFTTLPLIIQKKPEIKSLVSQIEITLKNWYLFK